MTQYAAFLRGVAPTSPNMHNKKLRSVFEGLGFTNVTTVISSGNIIFESPVKTTSNGNFFTAPTFAFDTTTQGTWVRNSRYRKQCSSSSYGHDSP